MATVLPKHPVRAPANTIANLRWYICGLLFFATTVNYIDRQVLGLLKPVLEKETGLDRIAATDGSSSHFSWPTR